MPCGGDNTGVGGIEADATGAALALSVIVAAIAHASLIEARPIVASVHPPHSDRRLRTSPLRARRRLQGNRLRFRIRIFI